MSEKELLEKIRDVLREEIKAIREEASVKESYREEEINLLDLFLVLLKQKRLIIAITLTTAIITAIVSFIIPPVYMAETTILPRQIGSSATMEILEQFRSFEAQKTLPNLYVGLIKSKKVLDRIIDRFNLVEVYKVKSRTDVREILSNNVQTKVDQKSGLITISVYDRDPKRAADMANAFVEELKNLTRGLALTEASQRGLFFEEQLKEAKLALIKAEEEMKAFQEKIGALKVEEETRAVIERIANLKAEIAAKEVELKVMRTYLTPNNPDLQKAEESLRAMKLELAKLEPLMYTEKTPEIARDYLRKLVDFRFNEAFYELLLKHYQAARLDEARDAVVIQVTDKAIPPEKKAKPKRALMITIATLTAFMFSIFIAFIMEYINNMRRDPEGRERLEKKFKINI
ncbi:MAG: Wzz/FepE/Etk N-terminal domain-containing protein [Aquificaceae bacterium]|nr:Wzz/FepE/Etk N-terminal domain-containing protein [Aquificaceae bacterium]